MEKNYKLTEELNKLVFLSGIDQSIIDEAKKKTTS